MSWGLLMPATLVSMLVVWLVALAAARRWPETRRWVRAIVLAVAAVPLAILLHNVLSALIGVEEAVTFVVALALAPALFTVGTLGLGIELLRDAGRRELGTALLIAGGGAALFSLLMLFSLVVTSIPRTQPDYLVAAGRVGFPTAVLALVAGAVCAAMLVVRRPGIFTARV